MSDYVKSGILSRLSARPCQVVPSARCACWLHLTRLKACPHVSAGLLTFHDHFVPLQGGEVWPRARINRAQLTLFIHSRRGHCGNMKSRLGLILAPICKTNREHKTKTKTRFCLWNGLWKKNRTPISRLTIFPSVQSVLKLLEWFRPSGFYNLDVFNSK